jgi:two-component system, OmpR family, sensor histidine kinase KdpD
MSGYNGRVPGMIRKPIPRYVVSGLVVVAIVYAFHKFIHVNPTTVALSFLLAVLVVSATWGLRYAVFVAVTAALAFNYFFLPPVGTLIISDPQNWVALVAFLITAVVSSQLSERARREARNANTRRQEVERLYSFSQQLLSTDNIAELLNAVPRYVVESFDVNAAAISLANRADVYRSGPALEGLELRDLQLVTLRGEAKLDPANQLSFVPLKMGLRIIGSLGVAGGLPSRQSLDAVSSLIAIAIERAGTIEKLGRAEASRESEQLRSVLLDSVTHEFRTPLTGIKASVTTLLSNSNLNEAQRQELLAIINEESDRLNRLVEEAARMSQLDAGKVEFDLRPHAIRETLSTALSESKQTLGLHAVEVHLPEDLPAVRIDPLRIKEVLVQLLENAAKYSPADSPIHVRVEAKNRMVTISVADRGPGIDDFEQSLIFDKFYRGQNQRLSVQGTGMGLAIVKAIVEAHGGTVGVTSQLGRGSVFYFSVPAV